VSAWRHNVRLGSSRRSRPRSRRTFAAWKRGPTFADEGEARLFASWLIGAGNAALQREFGFYVEPGHYAEAVERYRALFGVERMKVLFFEDLARDPDAVTAEAVAFLGLEPQPLEDRNPQNEATSPLATRLNTLVSRIPGVSSLSPALRTRVRRWIAVSGKSGAKAPVSDTARRELAEHFRPHNRRLAALTGGT
jgi:hypothetical protein